jgi:hypothetical protein
MNNLKKLIFVSKKWLNELSVSCTSPSNLMELIERNIDLKKDLEKIRGAFVQDGILEYEENNSCSFSSNFLIFFHLFQFIRSFSILFY